MEFQGVEFQGGRVVGWSCRGGVTGGGVCFTAAGFHTAGRGGVACPLGGLGA